MARYLPCFPVFTEYFFKAADNMTLPDSSTPDATGINGIVRQQNNKTRISIIGHKDFSIDSMARLIEASSGNYQVTCTDPGETGLTNFTETNAEVLMIQDDTLRVSPEYVIHSILDTSPDIRILVFGKAMDDEHLFQIIRAGAHGYINERMNGEHIKRALVVVLNGKTWIERHIMERFIRTQHEFDDVLETRLHENINQLYSNLTRREIQILCEVFKGLAIKQIADEVHLSHQGVKMHLAKLFRKFKVTNRNQLILAAFNEISPGNNISALLLEGSQRK
ncbi:MAG TPA: response regulator transcription factor [Gammaproteobacteria bacterium]|nr:response regulator transcription factor [Gammaproteobacteria bacterium]